MSGALGYFMSVTVTALGQLFTYNTRQKLYAHLQTLSQGYFEKAQTGKIVSTIVNDDRQINQLITGGFINIIQDSVTLVGVIFYLFYQNANLAFLALSGTHLCRQLLFDAQTLDRQRRQNIRIARRDFVRLAGKTGRNSGRQIVCAGAGRSPNLHEPEPRQFESQRAPKQIGYGLFARAEFISAIGTAVILCVGGSQVIDGKLRPGDLVAFLIYATTYLYAPTVRLIQLNDQIARTQTGLARIFGILDTEPLVVNDTTAPDLPPIEGHIRYSDVWFAYEPEQWVIKGINLSIEPGQLIAFVGGSGSGKTTMINLLSRHYDVTKGALTIDGHDVRSINLMSLRKQVGVVLQESVCSTRALWKICAMAN